MSKCRKCHLRETKFAKFPGGACPQTPLEARAVGARLSAFGANRASLFLLKRGWNVCKHKHKTSVAQLQAEDNCVYACVVCEIRFLFNTFLLFTSSVPQSTLDVSTKQIPSSQKILHVTLPQ